MTPAPIDAKTTRYFPNGPCPGDPELTHLIPVTLQSSCSAEFTYPPELDGPVEWHYCRSVWGACA